MPVASSGPRRRLVPCCCLHGEVAYQIMEAKEGDQGPNMGNRHATTACPPPAGRLTAAPPLETVIMSLACPSPDVLQRTISLAVCAYLGGLGARSPQRPQAVALFASVAAAPFSATNRFEEHKPQTHALERASECAPRRARSSQPAAAARGRPLCSPPQLQRPPAPPTPLLIVPDRRAALLHQPCARAAGRTPQCRCLKCAIPTVMKYGLAATAARLAHRASTSAMRSCSRPGATMPASSCSM